MGHVRGHPSISDTAVGPSKSPYLFLRYQIGVIIGPLSGEKPRQCFYRFIGLYAYVTYIEALYVYLFYLVIILNIINFRHIHKKYYKIISIIESRFKIHINIPNRDVGILFIAFIFV